MLSGKPEYLYFDFQKFVTGNKYLRHNYKFYSTKYKAFNHETHN